MTVEKNKRNKQEKEVTCHVLHLNGLVKDLVPLVGLKGHRRVVLREAVRNLSIARPTHLEANPSVATTNKDDH